MEVVNTQSSEITTANSLEQESSSIFQSQEIDQIPLLNKLSSSELTSISEKFNQSTLWTKEEKKNYLKYFFQNLPEEANKAYEQSSTCINLLNQFIFNNPGELNKFKKSDKSLVLKHIGLIKSTPDYNLMLTNTIQSRVKVELDNTTESISQKDYIFQERAGQYKKGLFFDKLQNRLNNNIALLPFFERYGLANLPKTERESRLDKILAYQLYLHQKAEQAKTNPSITLTPAEQQSSKNFSSFLYGAGIDISTFFASSANTPEYGLRGAKSVSSESEQPSLATINSPKTIQAIPDLPDSASVASLDSALHKKFPGNVLSQLVTQIVPKETIATLAFLPETESPDAKKPYQKTKEALKNFLTQEYPFLDQMLPNATPDQLIGPKTALFCSLLGGPDRQISDGVFAACGIQPKPGETVQDQIDGRKASFASAIQDKCITPIDEAINRSLSSIYLDHIRNFMKQTPGLEECILDPKLLQVTFDGFTFPYTLNGERYTLQMINGKLTASSFRDENAIDGNTSFGPGTEQIGAFPTMREIHARMTQGIPETIAELVASKDFPKKKEQIIQSAKNTGSDTGDDTEYEQASLAHNIAAQQHWKGFKNFLFNRDKPTPESRQTAKSVGLERESSPFAPAFRILQDKQRIDANNASTVYPICKLFEKSALVMSAQENERCKQAFAQLNTLRADPIINQKLQSISISSDIHQEDEHYDKSILALLNPNESNNPEHVSKLLLLLSDNPGTDNARFNPEKMEQLISQLNLLRQPSSSLDDFEFPIRDIATQAPSVKQRIAQAEAKNADNALDAALEGLDNGDETIA